MLSNDEDDLLARIKKIQGIGFNPFTNSLAAMSSSSGSGGSSGGGSGGGSTAVGFARIELSSEPMIMGETYIFNALILDSAGAPVVPDSAPTIKLYDKTSNTLLFESTMLNNPSITGAYQYSYEVKAPLTQGSLFMLLVTAAVSTASIANFETIRLADNRKLDYIYAKETSNGTSKRNSESTGKTSSEKENSTGTGKRSWSGSSVGRKDDYSPSP